MGKTLKKAAPGGDERNLYDRRHKATTAPSKASETSLHERQRESESSKRPKLSSLQKNIPPGQRKTLKKKLRSPTKRGASSPKQLTQQSVASRGKKTLIIRAKRIETKTTKMQPESEESEVKLDVAVEEKVAEESSEKREKEEEHVDSITPEKIPSSEESIDSKNLDDKEPSITEVQLESTENENESQPNTSSQSKESEEQEENDLKLSFDTEESTPKTDDQSPRNEPEIESKEESQPVETEITNGIREKEDLQSEAQTDTESYSVDIVEYTASELSEASETVSQSDNKKEKKKPSETASTELPFVSYDPSITLKYVQIKLNDCLKDNSKQPDESNIEHDTPSGAVKDMSFGKTLRNISGRHSISRMRHVTLREQKYSPNSSLFVNTSTMSLPQDDTGDCKVLRYSIGLPGTPATNGNPLERKRKLESKNLSSAKKQKVESDYSFLDVSMSLLKGFRRPVQVSTPVAEYKFPSSKLNISGINDEENKIMNEPIEGAKKWCSIM